MLGRGLPQDAGSTQGPMVLQLWLANIVCHGQVGEPGEPGASLLLLLLTLLTCAGQAAFSAIGKQAVTLN